MPHLLWPCSFLWVTQLTADAVTTCWLPRILFSKTLACRVENSSCLIRRGDNRSPIPLYFLPRPQSFQPCRPLIAVLSHMLSYTVTQLVGLLCSAHQEHLVSCCSFISQRISHCTEPKVSKQLNAVNQVILGLEGYGKVWYVSPFNYSWLTCLKNPTARFYFSPPPISLECSLTHQVFAWLLFDPGPFFPAPSLCFS